MNTRTFIVTALLVAFLAASVGADVQVNINATGNQQHPDVATDSAGHFVIVWQGDEPGFGQGIMGRVYDATGNHPGYEFAVNQAFLGDQLHPAVAFVGDGSFWVLYQSFDGSSFGIAQRHFSSHGLPLGDSTITNSTTAEAQTSPAIAGGGLTSFGAWESDGQDGSGLGIFGRSVGVPTAEGQLNVTTAGDQAHPAVGCTYLNDDPFVLRAAVAYQSADDVKLRGIADLFTSELSVNTHTAGAQAAPALACSHPTGGNLLVVWHSEQQDGDGLGVFGRVYDPNMSPLGPEFQMNQYTMGDQASPDVAADGDGNFIVVWQSQSQDGSGDGIFGRRFDSAGNALGDEFQVNLITANDQLNPKVAAQPDGAFVVVWTDVSADGSGSGVFARRLVPAAVGETIAAMPGFSVQVDVTTPNAGMVTVEKGNDASAFETGSGMVSFNIEAPAATPDNPLVLRFVFEATIVHLALQLPQYADTLTKIYRNSIEVPDCSGAPGTAAPDPCVASRWWNPENDLVITVLTSAASQWGVSLGECPANPDSGCITGFGKSSLLIDQRDPTNQKLVAKLLAGPALTQTDLGNPLSPAEGGTGTIMTWCAYDADGDLAGQLYVPSTAVACEGIECWSAIGKAPNDPDGPGKGYKYKETTGAADGVQRLIYKGGVAGKSKALVKASGANLPAGLAAALTGSTQATLQLRVADGACLSATLNDIKRADETLFRAK